MSLVGCLQSALMERPPTTPSGATGRSRWLFAAGALGAAVVTLVFATIGDGVDTEAEGWRGALVDYGHTAVWALLAMALGIAALTGGWHRISGALASVALAVYVLFLMAVLLGS